MYTLTQEELDSLNTAESFTALANVAHGSLVRMRKEHPTIIQICGPMSTGGFGDLTLNMARFDRAIEIATRNGVSVFNQTHYQNAMIRICQWKPGDPYPQALLEDFYGEIFRAKHIDTGMFLPDWQSSIGSRWEWRRFKNLNIPVESYPQEWLRELLL